MNRISKLPIPSFAVVLGVAALLMGVSASAGNFIYTPITAPGFESTSPTGINASGQIVGTAAINNIAYSFLYTEGNFSPINVPGASSTGAYAINNQGQIAGQYSTPSGISSFVKTGDTFTSINVPGAEGTYARGINDTGAVAGFYTTSAGNIQGFVFVHHYQRPWAGRTVHLRGRH